MDTLREKIARELFGIWKEAKENTPDPWESQWEELPEKHQREYLLTADSILALIRQEVEQVDNPFDLCNGADQCEIDAFEQARQAVLKVLE